MELGEVTKLIVQVPQLSLPVAIYSANETQRHSVEREKMDKKQIPANGYRKNGISTCY